MIYDSSEDSEVESNIVMERAKEIQENLDPNFPSFIKLMLRSHVTKGFLDGKCQITVTVVDMNNN